MDGQGEEIGYGIAAKERTPKKPIDPAAVLHRQQKRERKAARKEYERLKKEEEQRRFQSATGGRQDGANRQDPSQLGGGQYHHAEMYSETVFADIRAHFVTNMRDEQRSRIRRAIGDLFRHHGFDSEKQLQSLLPQ